MTLKTATKLIIGLAALSAAGNTTASADYNKLPATSADESAVYRVYNPNSGEHFYTRDSKERSYLISLGWRDESIGWYAPVKGEAVYRLYNPNAGDHYYTKSVYERDSLVSVGWRAEGTGWNSGGETSIFVAYNPNAKSGAHNYTSDQNEQNHLLSVGWRYGAEAWKAVTAGLPEKGKLPAPRPEASKTSIDLDAAISEMQKLVVAKGEIAQGTRVIVFHDMGMTTGALTSGVYTAGDHIPFTPHVTNAAACYESDISAEDLAQFYSSSFYPVAADGAGNETAVLTAAGWYLLPDVGASNFDGTFKKPDLEKFIQTGDPKDLTSYTDGTALVYNGTDQFGGPVKISE